MTSAKKATAPAISEGNAAVEARFQSLAQNVRAAESATKEKARAEALAAVEACAREISALHAALRAQGTPGGDAASGEESYGLLGTSKPMRDLLALVRKAGAAEVSVLITGENGSGKEGVARALWSVSRRKAKPFLTVNCGALQDSLLETELFGHVKGAFTGAHSNKVGLFEQADKGTLFLDEIGDTSPALQVKLLRVLQEGTFLPVGATQEKKVDVRVLAATNKPLKSMMKEGTFREDLYFRLNVVHVPVPPLRERPDDIPLLAQHFLDTFLKEDGRETRKIFQSEVLHHFQAYPWPGNVRELKNLVSRLAIMTDGEYLITESALADEMRLLGEKEERFDLSAGMEPLMKEFERKILLYAVKLHPNNLTDAARLLGLTVTGLRYKFDKVGLFVPAGKLASANRRAKKPEFPD